MEKLRFLNMICFAWEQFCLFSIVCSIEKLSKVKKSGCFLNLEVTYSENGLRLILDKGGSALVNVIMERGLGQC